MEKWKGKVAVITGGNAGNGFATLKKLAREGITVVGFDIATEVIENFAKHEKDLNVHFRNCDITKDDMVVAAFEWIEKTFGGVDILVNNAGIFRDNGVLEYQKSMAEITQIIDLNFTALVRCSRLAFKSMVTRDSYGYIININSVYGHSVVQFYNKANIGVYPGTKYAVTATTEAMRFELINLKNKKSPSFQPFAGRCQH